MTSISSTSQTRKFQFFDEIKENISLSEENNNKIIEKKDYEEENPSLKKLNINISSIVPTKEMQVMDGIIFVCGSVFYKETKLKTNRMLKIIDNEVIDEYTMLNNYYDFILMRFSDKPLLIVFGLMKKITNDQSSLSQVTSIKFYDASEFIEKRNERYPVKAEVTDLKENYPEILLREIKLYKKGNSAIVCEADGNRVEGLDHLEKCIGLTVDSYLNYAAIGLDRGEIAIISAFPNLLDCKGKKMKCTLISLPEKGGSYIEITNIKLGELDMGINEKKILYVSTKTYLAYYEWNIDEKGTDDLDNSIPCKFINNIPGVLEGCLCLKNNSLLIASADDKFIYEYSNCKLNKLEKDEKGLIDKKEKGKRNGELAFEGHKKSVIYYNSNNSNNYYDYIVYQIPGKTFSTIQIFDNINNFFVYIKSYSKKILSITSDPKYIYVFIEENESKKYIIKLAEKENKKKFDTFFSRKLYDIAADYAKYLFYDDNKLTEIYKLQAEFEYSRGEFDKSIQAYINTINYLDPSIIIQKFLTKSKMDFLIKYLEAIESNITFKQRSNENYKNYTTLLLNCYLMKEEIPKLKEFINKKKDSISPEILKTVIDVCLDTQNIDLALSIANSKDMYEDYLQILIIKLNKIQEALDFIYSDKEEERKKSKLKVEEQINLFCKFGENFLKSIPRIFFDRVKKFLELNKGILKKEDDRKLLEIFISNDTFYKDVFKMMSNFGLELDKNMLHRRIELHLEDNENQKIIEILKDKNYIGLYDNEYLMMLFKHKNFSDGIEVLSELTEQRHELLSIYIQKRDYEKIIKLCNEYGNSERSFWGISLNFFVDKSVREAMDEKELDIINEYLQKFLETILIKKAILPMNVLDIINEKNNEIPLDILRKFIDKSLEDEIEPLKQKVANFDGYNSQLKVVNNKIKEIQTQASSFKLSKCEQCFMGITFPAICFRCGHCYHSMCLNANDDNDLDDVDCPKCEEKKETVKQQMLEMKSIYEDINSKEKLKEALDYAEDKFQYVHNLYGRGVINIGPAYDEYTTKEIKEALALVEDSK
jgi:hypothetical protein